LNPCRQVKHPPVNPRELVKDMVLNFCVSCQLQHDIATFEKRHFKPKFMKKSSEEASVKALEDCGTIELVKSCIFFLLLLKPM
jgi:hypothetical protein